MYFSSSFLGWLVALRRRHGLRGHGSGAGHGRAGIRGAGARGVSGAAARRTTWLGCSGDCHWEVPGVYFLEIVGVFDRICMNLLGKIWKNE